MVKVLIKKVIDVPSVLTEVSRSISCKDWALWPETRAAKHTLLRVSSFKLSLSRGNKVFRNFSTVSTSQVMPYFGRGGLKLKIPFINLLRSPLSCKFFSSVHVTNEAIALLAVPIALKDKFS